jgi:thiol-disulfide isomerase/thioredoxin
MPASTSPLVHLAFGTALAISLAACEGKPTRSAPQASAPAAATAPTAPPAPAFAGRTLDGEPFDLVGLRGQVVLLNVWATWCEPCRKEMPELQALHARHREQGFTVVGVSVDAARLADTVRQSVVDFGLRYPNIHDPQNTISAAFKVNGYPTSFLIDRNGGLVWRKDGMLEPGDPELAQQLARTLAAP